MTERKGEWMQTYKGVRFYVEDPRPEDIVIEDIAHALSLLCRFGGHTPRLYSVAEHSVRVSTVIESLGGSIEDQFEGLMHDASEAYLGDVIWPLKRSGVMDGYAILEDRVMDAIKKRFGMREKFAPIVKHADLVMLATEKRDLMTDKTTWREAEAAQTEVGPWHCDHIEPAREEIVPHLAAHAEHVFLTRFMLLQEKRS